MRRLLILLCAVAALLQFSAGLSFAAGVAVIVNRANSTPVDRGMISRIYLGRMSMWPGGGVVQAVNLPSDDPAAATFNAGVLAKSPQAIKEVWAQNVFTGKAIPPKVVGSDAEVKQLVSRNKNAIGYISSSSLDDSVKAVLTLR